MRVSCVAVAFRMLRPSDVAVLARTNAVLSQVREQLSKSGLLQQNSITDTSTQQALQEVNGLS